VEFVKMNTCVEIEQDEEIQRSITWLNLSG
jgi:hypothetical protein